MFIVGTLPPGKCGIGDYTHQLARATALENREPAFALSVALQVQCTTFSEEDTYATDSNTFKSSVIGLLHYLKLHKPDVVHIQFPSQGFYRRILPSLLPLICTLVGKRVVVTHHEIYQRPGWHRGLIQSIGSRGSVFVRPNFIEQCPEIIRRILAKKPWSLIPNASPIPPSKLSASGRQHLRDELSKGRQRLLVFFGFVYPSKGVALLFDMANPRTDRILIAGDCPNEDYRSEVIRHAESKGWSPSDYEFAGYLDEERSSDLLAAADAVVLPFLEGGGEWNTSIHGAVCQGTLVITTSGTKTGFDPVTNVAYRAPGDVSGMKDDLDRLCGHRIAARSPQAEWRGIASRHLELYARVLS